MKASELKADERVLFSASANRRPAGGGRSVGGRLLVTDARLIHVPGRADRLFGAQGFECALADVAETRDEGRFKSRVRAIGITVAVELRSGATERFVVWNSEGLIEAIRHGSTS